MTIKLKLFVCICSILAVSNAGGGHGSNKNYHGHNSVSGGSPHNGKSHGDTSKVIRVKIIDGGMVNSHGNVNGNGNGNAPQIIRVIHEESSSARGNSGGSGGHSGYDSSMVSQVIRIIHEHAAAPQASASSPTNSVAPQATQVIKVIHINAAPGGGSSGALRSGVQRPAKVIRVIHEQGHSQGSSQIGSFTNAPIASPTNSYIPPQQGNTPAFTSTVPQYAPAFPQATTSSQYLPPIPR